jgi:hypothetical protein
MRQSVRRVLTTFVFSTLTFVGPSFSANAITQQLPTFTATPNPVVFGQFTTLDLGLTITPNFGEVITSISPASSFTISADFGGQVNGGFIWTVQSGVWSTNVSAGFSYPNPGTHTASYSFDLLAVNFCKNFTITDCTFGGFSGGSSLDVIVNPVAQVPLPGTLPLFATGLGVLGLLGWKRKRIQKTECKSV